MSSWRLARVGAVCGEWEEREPGEQKGSQAEVSMGHLAPFTMKTA